MDEQPIKTLNGQIVKVLGSEDEITMRVAKDAHNRAVVKLDGEGADALIRQLIKVRGGEWLDMLQSSLGEN